MKIDRFTLITVALFLTAAVSAWMSIAFTKVFFVASASIVVAAAIFISVRNSVRKRKFWLRRQIAMEAIESLGITLDYYDKELPLDYRSRFKFQMAVDHACLVTDSLRSWIQTLQMHFERNYISSKGLQLEDVPALIDSVRKEVIAAYSFCQGTGKDQKPAILNHSWFNEAVLLNTPFHEQHARGFDVPKKLSLVQTAPAIAMVAIASTARNPALQETSMQHIPSQPTESAQPEAQRLLTYEPKNSHHVACTVSQFQARQREKSTGRNRDVISHEVLQVDFKARKRVG